MSFWVWCLPNFSPVAKEMSFFGDEVLGKTIEDLVFPVSMQVGVFFAGLNPWLSLRGSLEKSLDILDFRTRG